MGYIELEGWKAVIDDITALNNSPEISRLGLVFEQHYDVVSACAEGNVSAYYNILIEIIQRIISGGFIGTVTLCSGEKKTIKFSNSYVIENGEDITSLIIR